jgi:hypothetical protein
MNSKGHNIWGFAISGILCASTGIPALLEEHWFVDWARIVFAALSILFAAVCILNLWDFLRANDLEKLRIEKNATHRGTELDTRWMYELRQFPEYLQRLIVAQHYRIVSDPEAENPIEKLCVIVGHTVVPYALVSEILCWYDPVNTYKVRPTSDYHAYNKEYEGWARIVVAYLIDKGWAEGQIINRNHRVTWTIEGRAEAIAAMLINGLYWTGEAYQYPNLNEVDA